MPRCISSASGGGVMPSSSPTRISVGQRMVDSSDAESGRVISARTAPAMPSAELARMSDRTSSTTAGARPLRRLAEELGHHVLGDAGGTLRFHEPQHLLPPLDPFGGVGLRFRVGEDQPLKVARRVAEDRERDVAAHRHAADDGLVDVQRIEQIDHVAGVVVDRGRRRIAGSAAEAAQVRAR